MRHIDFDDLWKNHLFDYKDGDLLVIDDITRLNLSDYENTTLAFVMAVFCVEGRLQCVVEGREYRIGGGDFFVYMPGQVIGEILLSQHAEGERFFRPSEYAGLSSLYGAVSRVKRSCAQRVSLCQYAEHHPEISLQMCERRVWPFAP